MRAVVDGCGRELASHVELADSLFSRMKGLLGRNSLATGHCLWIKPCKGVHTFFMHFPIDVVFLDKEQRVVEIVSNLPPNRMTPVYARADSVLELPACAAHDIVTVGDVILIE